MIRVPVSLSEEKATLLATLQGRAIDAVQDHPILGDQMAVQIRDQLDHDFSTTGVKPDIAAAIAARAAFLDGWARQFVTAHPEAVVLHLAAGLDSRVWRIDPGPGITWYDVDYPEVVELRQRLFGERPGYHLLGTSVIAPDWLEAIRPDLPTLVLAEGLTMYLRPEDGHTLFRRVTDHIGHGQIAVDSQNSLAVRLHKLNPAVRAAGATLRWGIDDPYDLVRRNARLRLVDAVEALSAPGTERLALVTRVAARMMRPFPPLRTLGMYLRYDF